MIGYAFCGSFCTLRASLSAMQTLVAAGEEIRPIISYNVKNTDTRFYRAEDFYRALTEAAGRPIIDTITEAEPLGPREPLELLIIAPCTGNTLAKLAHGITDTPVTMAAKAHLRAERPLLIAAATNDALSANLESIARLSMRKGVYFVPLRQDDPEKKPFSLVADFERIPEALAAARKGRQLRPLFI